MNNKELLDLYTDYLISSFGLTTGTGLSALLEGAVSHDRIQRFLAQRDFTSADLWQIVKPHVRAVEQDDGALIVDDSIAEKPYTDENDIIAWHYDHAQGHAVKGINFLSALYHAPGPVVSLPVGFRVVAKTEEYIDKKDGKTKRRSPISKNEHYQALIRQAHTNRLRFRYVLNDVWYASAENMMFVKHAVDREFIMPVKSNRKVALSATDKEQGRYVSVQNLPLEAGAVQMVYLEAVDFPLALTKQVFANEDGSVGLQYLVTSDLQLSAAQMTTIYRTRWSVEPYHKSLKQNAALEKSPTRTVRTQTNHLFAAMCGYIKLELLKTTHKLNHFALKAKLHFRALQLAFAELQQLQPVALGCVT
jgi:DDE superfamily endonuclease